MIVFSSKSQASAIKAISNKQQATRLKEHKNSPQQSTHKSIITHLPQRVTLKETESISLSSLVSHLDTSAQSISKSMMAAVLIQEGDSKFTTSFLFAMMLLLSSTSIVFAQHQYEFSYEGESERSALDFTPMLEDLANLDAVEATTLVLDKLTESVHDRMATIFEKATSAECRAKIATHFGYWINAIGNEQAAFPFVDATFEHECQEPYLDFDDLPEDIDFESLMHRTYQPPKDEALYIEDPRDLKILYGILMHGTPDITIRLIDTLYEDGHTFVIHVDGKPENDDAYEQLLRYGLDRPHVHIVPNDYRVRVNWGGYSMVNATMQILKYSFALLSNSPPIDTPLDFHKFVHLSASSYPLKSNSEIRERISSFPLDANMMMVIMQPLTPNPYAFHYYVECDDAVHRIHRIPPLTAKTHGADLYTASQWFIISREFAEYMARAEKGTFIHEFIPYAEHTVVADETFFGTVLKNSEFCTKHHNSNFLHLQFDRWESDIESDDRDEKKCLSPDPDRCGRSPTILTKDDFFALELSDQLFGRKFSDDSGEVLDILDEFRALDEMKRRDLVAGNFTEPVSAIDTIFQGHGALLVAKDTVDSDSPLCLGLGLTGYKVSNCTCMLWNVCSAKVS